LGCGAGESGLGDVAVGAWGKVIRDQKRGGISMRNAANMQGGVIKRLIYKARWEQEAADEKRKAAKYPN
jgi:hypothetical protein